MTKTPAKICYTYLHFLNGELPLSASNVNNTGKKQTYAGLQEYVAPKAMTTDEITRTIHEFAQAAQNAIDAGMDGVEIHGANGYLIEQFIADSTNLRTDLYGGSIENRCRFALQVVEAVCQQIGSNKTSIRLSPSGLSQGIHNSQPVATYEYLIAELNKFKLAYLHVEEPFTPRNELPDTHIAYVTKHFRPLYKGTLISNGGYSQATANEAVQSGLTDLVSFGKLFISNPDLVERFEQNATLSPYDSKTFYTQGAEGYTDYPPLSI